MKGSQTKIIVNADDFGIGKGIDEGILQLAEQGKISSTSILANGDHCEEGVADLQKRAPWLGTGVHICLDEERPVLSSEQLPTLTNSDGRFHSRLTLIRKLATGSIDLTEIKCEILAQFKKITDLGVEVTHFDGHGHVHIFPWINTIITNIAKTYGVTKARMPLDALYFRKSNWQQRTVTRLLINHWTKCSLRNGALNTMLTPKCFFGISVGGNLSGQSLNLLSLQKGVTNEIMVHPGLPTESEKKKYKLWKYSWCQEYQTLMQEIDSFVKRHNGILVSYGGL